MVVLVYFTLKSLLEKAFYSNFYLERWIYWSTYVEIVKFNTKIPVN